MTSGLFFFPMIEEVAEDVGPDKSPEAFLTLLAKEVEQFFRRLHENLIHRHRNLDADFERVKIAEKHAHLLDRRDGRSRDSRSSGNPRRKNPRSSGADRFHLRRDPLTSLDAANMVAERLVPRINELRIFDGQLVD